METLSEFLEIIHHLGHREAVRWRDSLRGGVWTYADLWQTIGALCADFDSRHIGKGDRILVWSENRPEWLAVFWACVARGVQIVPVDFRFSTELRRRIQSEAQPG